MNWKTTATTPAAADVREKARELNLTAAEQKTLAAVREKFGTAGKFHAAAIPPAEASRRGVPCPLQARLDAAAEAFAAAPSEKTAAEIERVGAAVAGAETIWKTYSDAETHLRLEAADTLRPVALALLERAAAALAVDLETARTALAAAPGLAPELAAFDARVARANEITAEQRAIAERSPLEWLTVELAF
jgi:hypothetical protein